MPRDRQNFTVCGFSCSATGKAECEATIACGFTASRNASPREASPRGRPAMMTSAETSLRASSNSDSVSIPASLVKSSFQPRQWRRKTATRSSAGAFCENGSGAWRTSNRAPSGMARSRRSAAWIARIPASGASVDHARNAGLRDCATGKSTCRIGKVPQTSAPPPRWPPSGWLKTTASGITPSRRNEGPTRRLKL